MLTDDDGWRGWTLTSFADVVFAAHRLAKNVEMRQKSLGKFPFRMQIHFRADPIEFDRT